MPRKAGAPIARYYHKGTEGELVDSSVLAYEDIPAKHKLFIHHFIRCGEIEMACERAGFKVDSANFGPLSRKLREVNEAHIQTQLKEYMSGTDATINNLKALMHLRDHGSTDAIKLQALKMLLERTDMGRVTEEKVVTHNHNHTVKNLTDDKLDAEIARLKDQLGAIDVTPEHVETEERAALPPA